MTSTSFASAQQRVAARRGARPGTATSQARNQALAVPTPLIPVATSLQTVWNTISGTSGTRPSPRVGQVDAELLDEELLSLFKGQVGEALKYYGAHIGDDSSDEILLALRAVLFKVTVWDRDANYGASLQNLRYVDARRGTLLQSRPARWQKALYGLITVGGRYAWSKWEDRLLDLDTNLDSETSTWQRRLSRLTNLATTTHTFASFASFLIFLTNGHYRTLLDRILRIRLVPFSSDVNRQVSFEYLNRQLVWHAFTEFLLFLLPLVGINRWRRILSRSWRKTKSIFLSTNPENENEAQPKGELAFLPERTCAICYQEQNPAGAAENEIAAMTGNSGGVVGSAQTDVTNPYEGVPCGCVYCFVCLAQRLDAEDGGGWVCLRCGEVVREGRPWCGDIVVDVEESGEEGKGEVVGDHGRMAQETFMKLDPMPEEEKEYIPVEDNS